MERIWLKSYPEGVPADINPTAYASLGDFFAASVDRHRDRPAYVSMKRTMTYGELDRLSRAFASYLHEVVRLPRGARVALMMPNLLQYPVALFGALRAGYIVVNCNPLYSPRELHHQLVELGRGSDRRARKFRPDAGEGDRGHRGPRRRRHRRRRPARRPSRAVANFVVRRIRRAVPPWRLPKAVRFNRALALGPRAQSGAAEDRAGRSRLPAIYRRDDRRAEGRDADPSQHDRQSSAGRRLDRAGRRRRAAKTFVTALPLYHVFALTVNAFVPMMIGANNLLIADPRDIKAFVKALARDAVHGHQRRQHAVQRAAEQPGLPAPRLLPPACRGRGRHGGPEGGRRALEACDRQAADRRLWPDRDLADRRPSTC